MSDPILKENLFTGKIFKVERWKKGDLERDIVVHGGAVAIILNINHNIVLVDQYRMAFACNLLEIPAGTIEPNEDPKDCIQREVLEEVGINLELNQIYDLGQICTSPGFVTEGIRLYYAELFESVKFNPQRSEDEHINIVLVPINKVEKIIGDKIFDAKTIVAWYRYVAKRGEDLRVREGLNSIS